MTYFKTNYHTHTNFSDGIETAENIVETAISENFKILGFSDHSPVPFFSKWNTKYEDIDSYINTINNLKKKFKNDITILIGMEIDFFINKNFITAFKNLFKLDYTIGAVHYLTEYFDDGTIFNIDKHKSIFQKALKEIFHDDIKLLVKEYYSTVNAMLENDTPDIIAHIDLINKFNSNKIFFNSDEQWYKKIIAETLDLAKQKNCIIEINCRSKYLKILNDFSPATSIIKQIKQFNIPVTIAGDIHKAQEFKNYWENAVNSLKNINFDTLTVFDNNGRKKIKI